MTGLAYVFCRTSGANGFGHVGGAFLLPNGLYRCFGTENPTGGGYVPWQQKGFWQLDCRPEEVVSAFAKTKTMMGITVPPYNLYKIKKQDNPDYHNAIKKLEWCAHQDYAILSPAVVKSRTCLDDVCDTLSAYGLWMPWTITYPAPNAWFGSMVDCHTYEV